MRRAIWFIVVAGMVLALPVPRSTAQDSDSSTLVSTKDIPIDITADGETTYAAGLATARDNVIVKRGGDLLYADRVIYDNAKHEVIADGAVRLYVGPKVYRGDHIVYNFETRAVTSTNFAVAAFPVFGEGKSVTSPEPDHYRISDGFATTENREHPTFRVHAHTIEILTGDRIVMKDVVLYIGDTPVFWLPEYYQSLKSDTTTFNIEGGTSTRFGLVGLATLNWKVANDLAVSLHQDYRSKRGDAGGVDLKYRPVKGGAGLFRSYYTVDSNYKENPTALPRTPISASRYRFALQQITPIGECVDAKVNANVWSDPYITEDFFQREFNKERMPDNTIEVANRYPDFEVSVLGRAQVNRFFDTTERAPEVRIESKPTKMFGGPVEYQSESSAVHFIQSYSNQQYSYPTRPKNYSANRWDTYHQFLMPQQYFGWLSSTPHIGLRGTAWSHDNLAVSGTSSGSSSGPAVSRVVVDAGDDFSAKVSRTWTDAKCPSLAIDGLRHVVSPFVDVEAVLPSDSRNAVRGFDTRMGNTWADPIDFPLRNSIDSIDRQLIVRQGVRQELQTKRDGQNWDLTDWSLFTDLNATSHYDEQQVFTRDAYSHAYSDARISPFPWLTFDSRDAVDLNGHSYNMYDNSLTWQPDRSFRITLGDRLLDKVSILDTYGFAIPNSNQAYLRLFYRMNEHWQFETTHGFDTQDEHLSDQSYTIYRDLSAWRLGMTYSDQNNRNAADVQTVYFTLTLKAFPSASLRFAE